MNEDKINELREEFRKFCPGAMENLLIEKFWLSRFETLLKERDVEHCDNEDCPECQTKLLDKYKKEFVEKIDGMKNKHKYLNEAYKAGYNYCLEEVINLIKQ